MLNFSSLRNILLERSLACNNKTFLPQVFEPQVFWVIQVNKFYKMKEITQL